MTDQERLAKLAQGEKALQAVLPMAEIMGQPGLIRGGIAIIDIQRQLIAGNEQITLTRQQAEDLIDVLDAAKEALG